MSFTPTPVATTPAEKLEGNWLIFGTMPRLDLPLTGPNPTSGLTLSLSSDGTTIAGSAFLSGTCASGAPFGILFGNGITAVPDAAGRFTTSSTQTFGWGFTLTGTAPNVAGRPWSGTYHLTNDGTQFNTCAFSDSGTFTATPVGNLTGTFAGSGQGSYAGSGSGLSPGNNLAVSLSLTQGGTYPSTNGTGAYDAELVQGQATVSGISCFAHGITAVNYPSKVVGNEAVLDFTMDDGSQVIAAGTIDNITTTNFLLSSFTVSGGACAGIYYLDVPGIVLSR